MKKITVNKTRILTAAAALVAVFSLAGCGSTAVTEVPQPAETSRSEEATLETAAPEATATPAPTPDVVVPTSVTLEQEGGILVRCSANVGRLLRSLWRKICALLCTGQHA